MPLVTADDRNNAVWSFSAIKIFLITYFWVSGLCRYNFKSLRSTFVRVGTGVLMILKQLHGAEIKVYHIFFRIRFVQSIVNLSM